LLAVVLIVGCTGNTGAEASLRSPMRAIALRDKQSYGTARAREPLVAIAMTRRVERPSQKQSPGTVARGACAAALVGGPDRSFELRTMRDHGDPRSPGRRCGDAESQVARSVGCRVSDAPGSRSHPSSHARCSWEWSGVIAICVSARIRSRVSRVTGSRAYAIVGWANIHGSRLVRDITKERS
jgi:hypothetical protein